MRKSTNVFFVLILFLMESCSVIPSYNYSLFYSPEETGFKMTQHTFESDATQGPSVIEGTTGIKWFSATTIAVKPDGLSFAYLATMEKVNNIMVRQTGGANSTIQRTFRNGVLDFRYSPNGKLLAFSDMVDGNYNIFIINANDGYAAKQIAASSSNELNPVFSPDNKQLFYTKWDQSSIISETETMGYQATSIWSTDLESGLSTQYTEGFSPDFFPEGEEIIFVRNNKISGLGEIWLYKIISGIETQLILHPKRGFSSPKVSPDGKWIVCTGVSLATPKTPMNLDIYIFKKDGSTETQITFHGGSDVSPTWSADGKSIFFISERGNKRLGQLVKYNIWNLDVTSIVSN